MFIRYGSTRLDANSATWTRHDELMHQNWVPYALRQDVMVRFTLLRDTPVLLAAASAAWTNACRVGSQDLALCLDSGAAVEALLSGPSISGVLCTSGPHWDDSPRGATYATMRECQTTFSAEYPVSGANYLNWQQTITLQGGTPVYVELPSIAGPWQQQQVSPSSPVTVVQSGSAVGIRGWPPFPPKIPGLPLVDQMQSTSSPQRVGLGFRGFPIQWQYTYRTVGTSGNPGPGYPPL